MKIKLVCLDDTLSRIADVAEALYLFFGGKLLGLRDSEPNTILEDGIRFVNQFIDFRYETRFDKAMDLVGNAGTYFDIAIVDLRWSPRTDGGEENEGGRDIFNVCLRERSVGRLLTLTAFGPFFTRQIAQLYQKNIEVIDDGNFQESIQERISEALKEAARIRIACLSPVDRNRILGVCERYYDRKVTGFVEEKICGWKLGNLLIGWRTHSRNSYPDNLPYLLHSLIAPDIALAASECFGIFGVKELTHGGSGYWDSKTVVRKSIEQSKTFISVVRNISNAALKSCLENRLQSWFDILNGEAVVTFDSSTQSCLTAQEFRDKYFKCQTKDVLKHLRETALNTVTLKEFELSGIKNHGFEIFINPVELSSRGFQTLFARVKSRAGADSLGICCLATKNDPRDTLKACDENGREWEAILYRNYLIISHDVIQGIDENLLFNSIQNQTICEFRGSGFYFLGEYYICLKEGDKLRYFDCFCEDNPPGTKVFSVDQLAHFEEFVRNCEGTRKKIYHIFAFNSWRPQGQPSGMSVDFTEW